MDRITWLREMRRECENQYDNVWAPLYGEEKAGLYDNATHLQFIQELLSLLGDRSSILDAACGAGRYEPFLLEKGHSILGIDQSQGMLARAQAKFPSVHFQLVLSHSGAEDRQGIANSAKQWLQRASLSSRR